VTFFRKSEPLFIENGIAPVIMDCPTDQWGEYGGPGPTNCFDDYRSSKTHADDVRGVMSALREAHGFKTFYLLGHSQGTVSSRWLARNLGPEIVGSIHSSAINVANPRGYARSMSGFKYAEIQTPMLHVHNEKDRCVGTPYGPVKAYAGTNLVTVRNSVSGSDACRDGPHGHEGVEELVARTIIAWIKTRQFDRVIGP
jgi:hypothetical protein